MNINLVAATGITVIFYLVAFVITSILAIVQHDAQGLQDAINNRTWLEVVYVFICAFIASFWVLAPRGFDDG